jgi:surfactin synthase thioesterase subunit
MKSNWLVRHVPRPEATVRLFCVPYAGGGASAYRPWAQALPANIEVAAIQAPGREGRLREPPIASIAGLVEALLPHLEPALDRPFAFFGHSMGAVLATEVTRALAEKGGPLPGHLYVSARRPPHLTGTDSPLRGLSDEAFVAEVQRRYGGIPPEVLQERELMELLLPCLRADMTALETHAPPPRAPLPCPISAFGGDADALTSRAELEAWKGETTGPFRVRVFGGGHFYLVAHRAAILADIVSTVTVRATLP